jgi:hypothetical protein
MPKEVVYGDDIPFGTPEQPPGHGRSIVEVRWAHEREGGDHVQVVSKCVDSATGGRLVKDDEGGPETIHYTDGFYVGLDRRGINKMIRALRRARDQAFGRDE